MRCDCKALPFATLPKVPIKRTFASVTLSLFLSHSLPEKQRGSLIMGAVRAERKVSGNSRDLLSRQSGRHLFEMLDCEIEIPFCGREKRAVPLKWDGPSPQEFAIKFCGIFGVWCAAIMRASQLFSLCRVGSNSKSSTWFASWKEKGNY